LVTSHLNLRKKGLKEQKDPKGKKDVKNMIKAQGSLNRGKNSTPTSSQEKENPIPEINNQGMTEADKEVEGHQ
jgi:hypothetical protein